MEMVKQGKRKKLTGDFPLKKNDKLKIKEEKNEAQ